MARCSSGGGGEGQEEDAGEGEADQVDPDGSGVPQAPHRQAVWLQALAQADYK